MQAARAHCTVTKTATDTYLTTIPRGIYFRMCGVGAQRERKIGQALVRGALCVKVRAGHRTRMAG